MFRAIHHEMTVHSESHSIMQLAEKKFRSLHMKLLEGLRDFTKVSTDPMPTLQLP